MDRTKLAIIVVTLFAPFQQHPFRCRKARPQFVARYRQLLLHLHLFGVQGRAGAFTDHFKFGVGQPRQERRSVQ
jgi:hypothetical protein